MTAEERTRPKAYWKGIGIAVVIGLLIVAARHVGIEKRLEAALRWIQDLGAWGPAVFILLYAVSTVLLLPGSILSLGAGFVFGLLRGFFYVWAGATLGAALAFLAGRHWAREWVARKISQFPRFKRLDEAVADEGWKIVALTRLSPLFPFNILNYAFGITRVSFEHYILATALGMIPGTLLFVYVGSLASELADVEVVERERTAAEWTFYALGLAATVWVTITVANLARKALDQRVPGA